MLTDIRHPDDPTLRWFVVSDRYEGGYWMDIEYRGRLIMFGD